MKIASLAAVLTLLLSSTGRAATQERKQDNIDLPFISDPAVIGAWGSVDFLEEPARFDPNQRRFRGDLELKELIFLPAGKTTEGWWTWTKGVLIHHGDKTASKYLIKEIAGASYMFLEWKSGDHILRHMKPQYYVLRKLGPMRTDNIDLPFNNDPRVLGRWQSVDFVKAPNRFDPAQRAWQGDLYLKEMVFLEGGKTSRPWQTWTKGYMLHHGDKTASHYELKTIDGGEYLFVEWKSGDYVFRNRAPYYYVLKKAS